MRVWLTTIVLALLSSTVMADDKVAEIISKLEAADAKQRAALLRELRAIGADGFVATREAAKSIQSSDLRSRVETTADWMLAEKFLDKLKKGLESQLTFDGQYRELRDHGEDATRVLFRIIDDTATPYPFRLAACRAIADVADKKIIPELRRLNSDILLPAALKEQIGVLLAIFGDTSSVDRQLKDLERASRRPQIAIRIAAITELSNLYYRIRNYEKAVEYYDEILEVYEDFSKRATVPELKKSIDEQLTLHYYNAACSNSLKGDIKQSQKLLRKAVKRDPMHLGNIELDGDLLNLREDPGYEAFLKELGELFEGEDL